MNRTRNWTIVPDQMLSADEVAKLYQVLADARDLALQRRSYYCHVRDHYLLRTLLESGLRVSELAALKVGDHNGVALIVRRGKGGKRRAVLLAPQTQKLLREFLRIKREALDEPISPESPLFLSERRKPYSSRGIRRRVKFWFARCGFNPKLSCHSCRHTYISHMLAAGVDQTAVRDNAGHSSLAVTSIYAHTVRRDLEGVELYGNRSENSRTRTNKTAARAGQKGIPDKGGPIGASAQPEGT